MTGTPPTNDSRTAALPTTPVIGIDVTAVRRLDLAHHLIAEARHHRSTAVVIANTHVLVTARREPDYRDVLTRADVVTPDGMPLVWALRQHGHRAQNRVDGPTLMLDMCELASGDAPLPIFLFGSTDEVLSRLQEQLHDRFPSLVIAGAWSPPFAPPTEESLAADAARIADSGAAIVFVGLGAPKQERWMDAQRGRIDAVMVGVGAAFDFHAGLLNRAPGWMQRSGLEWIYRLVQEPRRLWRRYLVNNTLFLWWWLVRRSTR